MNSKPLTRAVVAFSCWAGLTCCAQAQELTWAERMFNVHKHDFGVVARGSDANFRFKIINKYKPDVHIADVRTTCGCTAASPSKDRLKTREAAYIEVKMDTRKFKGQKNSNLIVVFDEPFYQEVRIPIAAYIRSDVVISPGCINFGSVVKGNTAQQKITINYAGRNDWKIKKVTATDPNVSAKVVETRRDAGRVGYDLIVDLKPDAPMGVIRHRLTLHTDDSGNPRIPVLIEGRIDPEITVTPKLVTFGTLRPGEKKTINVVLRGRKPFLIEEIAIESDNPAFGTELGTKPRRIQVVPLTINTPDKIGKFVEQFTLQIADQDETIEFKVYGEIVPPQE